MNLLLTKKEIKEEVDKVNDANILLAIARLLNLEKQDSPEWHKQLVEERFVEYQRNLGNQNKLGGDKEEVEG